MSLERVLGVVTRRSVAGAPPPEPAAPVTVNLAGPLGGLGLDELFRHVQAVSAGFRGCYLVGGAVRDLLLAQPGFDVDLAVEGDGIAFATELAARLKGHVRAHEKFGTAVVVAGTGNGRLKVDVASTRAESYEYPGALPKVEHASIRSDLARRDFSINAMAVSLKPETFGDLFDFFGGREDLLAGRIVVLHNLSFIEDPDPHPARRPLREPVRPAHGRAHAEPGARLLRHGPRRRPLVRASARRAGEPAG